MPRVARVLSAVELKRLAPGRHEVGGVAGLILVVRETGKQGNWLLRATIAGRRRELGLGAWPGVGLADARRLAAADRESIKAGRDPAEERRTAREQLLAARKPKTTFTEAVDKTYEARKGGFKDEKGARRWKGTLTTHVVPVIGDRAVESLATTDIADLLKPIWLSQHRTATKVRERIEAVCDFCIAHDLVPDGFENPARWKGNLQMVMARPDRAAKGGNQPSVQWREAPDFYKAIVGMPGVAPQALRLLMLTGLRSAEVTDAVWDEIDLEAGLFIVPEERTKTGKRHIVPLSKEALAILDAVPRFEGCPWVFPSPTGKAFSNMALSAVCRRMQASEVRAGRRGWLDEVSKRPAVPHGLRATFRTWASEIGADPVLAEICLGHNVGTAVQRAYDRSEKVEARRGLLQTWADFLSH